MLVVMLILLVATGLASISLQTTQSELRAAGSNRLAVQTQYIAENAMVSTLSYIDQMAEEGSFCSFLGLGLPTMPARPAMWAYGEPNNGSSTAFLSQRTGWKNQLFFKNGTGGRPNLNNIPPLTVPGQLGPGQPGPGLQGSTGTLTDTLGTLGPQSPFRPGDSAVYANEVAAGNATTAVADYVVDLYDCSPLPAAGSVGNQAAGATSAQTGTAQFYCVATARGRAFLPNGLTKTWDMTFNGGGTAQTYAYTVNRFSTAHDARSTFVTGPTSGCHP